MFRYVGVCLALGFLPFAPAANASISEDLVFCAKLKSGSERLACYDAAARLEKKNANTTPTPRIVKAVEPTVSLPLRRWDGVFVGVGAAGSRINSASAGSLTSNPGGEPGLVVFGETTSAISSFAKGSGAGVDLHAGYMAQASSLVFGIQGDLLVPAIRADQGILVGRCDIACLHSFNFSNQGSLAANWIVSATVKAGWVTPDGANLLYALGGASYGDFSSNLVSGINLAQNGPYQFFFPRVGFAAAGWTAGLGWERRIADAWSLYAEYRFSRFGNVDQRNNFSYAPCLQGFTCTAVTQMSGSLDLQSVRFGVNRMFAASP